MKFAKFSAMLLGGALLTSASVFAGPTNKKSLHLPESMVIEGKRLAPGDYKVEWNEAGRPDVQVNILQGKNTVASFVARVVSLNHAIARDGYSATASQDGSKTLRQLFFGGKKYELQVQSVSAGSSAQTADTNRQN